MIKLFEEYNSYYKEIDEDEFDEGMSIDLTLKEIEYIDKIYPIRKLDSYERYYGIGYYAIDNNSWIYIYKLHDEWFLVKRRERCDMSSLDFMYIGDINSYYKCDQLEGLIKCLKDIYDKVI